MCRIDLCFVGASHVLASHLALLVTFSLQCQQTGSLRAALASNSFFANPRVIQSVSPTQGSASGGTAVEVELKVPCVVTVIVWFGRKSTLCDCEASVALCTSPSSEIGEQLLSVSFEDEAPSGDQVPFLYVFTAGRDWSDPEFRQHCWRNLGDDHWSQFPCSWALVPLLGRHAAVQRFSLRHQRSACRSPRRLPARFLCR